MAIVKDLGMVTAYAYAVAGGYEGTEAEFTEMLGHAGITLEQLENLTAVATTLSEGSEATASYADGVLTFGIPKGDTGATGPQGEQGVKGDTGNGIVSIAKTGTSGLVDTYTITFTDGTTTTFTVTNGADGDITNVAQAFDATKAYSAGDMVLYQGTLYVFTAAHAAGAWVGSDAQAVILTDEVTALKDDLNQEIDNLSNAIDRVSNLSDDLMLSKIVSWEHGTISTTDGTDDGSNTTRARTIGYISTEWVIDVNQNRPNVVYGFYLYYYDANHTFIYRSPYQLYEDTHIIPDASYPYYRIALLNRVNYATQDINLLYLANDFAFTTYNKTLTTIKNTVDNLVDGTKSLYIGELINGHLKASGVVDDSFTEYRLSTPEIVALPSGSFRKISVKINNGYLVAMRTGARSDNLDNNLYWYSDGDVITIPDGDNYYAISCCVNDGPPSYVTQKITPEATDRINLKLLVYFSDIFEDPEAEKVVNASRLKFDAGSSPNTLKSIAVITHTSDCHGDYSRVKNFFDFSDKIHADLAVVTGDMVSYKPYQKLDWFKEIVNSAKTRAGICVGNHDAYDDTLDDSGVYDLVFDGIASKIGNTSDKTWYYVDLADKALRVISVNLYQYGGTNRSYTHFTDEQLAWLCSTLASTPSGYGVVLLYHSPQGDLNASENYGKFYQNVRKYANTYNAVEGSPINDIIDAFIGRTTITKTYTQTGSPASVSVSGDFTSMDSSVEFIAHLTGHFHQDSVCYVPGTTHLQLMLNVVCTNAIYGGAVYPYLCDLSDLPRNNEDATQNSFNVYAIDREEGVVRITRVGSNTNYAMQKRDYMSIPYKS